MFIVFPAVSFLKSYPPDFIQNTCLSTVILTKGQFLEIRFFPMFLLYFSIRKRGLPYGH